MFEYLGLSSKNLSRATSRRLILLNEKMEAAKEERCRILNFIDIEKNQNETIEESEREQLIRIGQLNPLEGIANLFECNKLMALKKEANECEAEEFNLFKGRHEEIDLIKEQAATVEVEITEEGGLGNSMAEPVKLVMLDERFRVPELTWNRLFGYQRTGVAWLWALHQQGAGGILGDEMGLGKTVQVVALLAGLQASGLWNGPSLVVAPATVLRQWASEIRSWAPALRSIILHASAQDMPNVALSLGRARRNSHIVVTTYSLLQRHARHFLGTPWFYAILDEGHKIRNPEAAITAAAKALNAQHRLCVTGTPIQNNLTELWSVMDFCCPGRLGSLAIFQREVAGPIHMGGYASAGPLQLQTAYRCACALRDLIRPLLLRRWKKDVATDLPPKEEHIVLCRLTPTQRRLYEAYLRSGHLEGILAGRANMLCGIDILRKICNDPRLLHGKDDALLEDLEDKSDNNYELEADLLDTSSSFGNDPLILSGKYRVLRELLAAWHTEGRKVLLFCQTRRMLDLLEQFVRKNLSYSALRMDGLTDVAKRGYLVDNFNTDPSLFCFLLTTRVGGLGINLTAASRVIIFDPDWNPSTDLQARERAYRIGQTSDVHIFRFICAGAIEEKIYHRQIFKQILTNRILQNPKLSRFFKPADIHDLFTLAPDDPSLEAAKIEFKRPKIEKKSISDESSFDAIYQNSKKDSLNENESKSDSDSSHMPATTDKEALLDTLLKVSGVETRIHDDVMNTFATPDAAFLGKEADKIVSRAMSLLQDSNPYQKYILSKHVPMLTPATETASILGTDVQPSKTAQDILFGLAAKNVSLQSIPVLQTDINALGDVSPLALQLVSYMKSKGGSATTDEILAEFQDKVSPDESILFKKILKSIARLTPIHSSRKVWILNNSI
jgi:DNA excision repair protein ERCC-6